MRVVDHAMTRLVEKWKLILVTRVHSERRSRRVSPRRGVSLDQERGIRCARSSKVEQRGNIARPQVPGRELTWRGQERRGGIRAEEVMTSALDERHP